MSNLVTEPHLDAVRDNIQEEETEEEGVVHTHTSPSILCSDWDCAWLPANPTMRASTPRAARALRAATILTTAAKAGLVASQLHNVPPLPLAHQVLTAAGLIARPTAWPRLTLRTLTNRKAGPAVSR